MFKSEKTLGSFQADKPGFLSGHLRYGIVAILFAAFLNCTAYLNTFYNAESAFKEAQTVHSKLMRDNPDSLIVTPSQIASTSYDRAIEKSLKVIEVYSKKKKWHDDALFLLGKAYYYKREPVKSMRWFNQLQQEFPTSPLIPESYLYLGKAYIEDENLDKAEQIIEMVLQKYPSLDKNQQVSLLLVDIAIRREGKAHAIILLEKARGAVKSEAKQFDLILRVSELYIELKQYQKAVKLLTKTPRKKKFPVQSYRMDRALLASYMGLDSLNIALKLVDAMAKNRLYSQHIDEILLTKGIILKRLGRFDEAIAILKKVTKDIDSTNVASDTSRFVAQALYELALIYQKKMGDYSDAKKLYKMASKARDTVYSGHAIKRLSAMEKLDKLRSSKDETADIRLFKIAELFRFELDEPDSAFNQFVSLSADSGVEAGVVPKALCAAAFIARDEKRDTTVSDSIFDLIIRTYPASDFARLAQKQLNIPVTVKTRSDSASEAYLLAENLVYKDNEIKGAIRAFFDIYKKYSDLPVAPKALYAAAWLSDDVLQKNRTAKTLYEKICEKYPETVYCKEQAKPKINLVLDTLKALGLQSNAKEPKAPEKKNFKGRRKTDTDTKQISSVDSIKAHQQSIEDSMEPLSVDEMNETISQIPESQSNDSVSVELNQPDSVKSGAPVITNDSSSVSEQ